MTAFMYTTPGHIAKIVFVYAGSKPDILAAEIGGKWMFSNILPSTVKIKSQLFYQIHSELPLFFFWIVAHQKSILYLRAGGNPVKQVFQGTLQRSKNLIQQFHRASALI